VKHPVDRYVDALLRRRRPRPFAPTQDDLKVLRTAIDLAAVGHEADEPRPDFVRRLRADLSRLEPAAQPDPAPAPAWRAQPRRRVLTAAVLTATGAAIGVEGQRVLTTTAEQQPDTSAAQAELDPSHGVWRCVAASADLPEGAVLSFDLGAVNGFVRRVSGRVQAVSGTCTHQGCRLDLDADRSGLTCPCHGATFTTAGVNLTHPRQVGRPLPALPRLAVRELDGHIEVYAPGPRPTP
jgi:cytochrome b6-f complex iron-sulfur subunit